MKSLNNILLGIVLIFATSCGVRVNSGSPDTNKVFESYFVDKGIFQYFVNPLKYKDKSNFLIPDITFRDSSKSESKIIVNFTIQGTVQPNLINYYTSIPIKFENISLLYADKVKNISRYTSTIKYSQFKDICKFPNHKIIMNLESDTITLYPNRKTLKRLTFVDKYLFQ
ncbi:MAG TPA: hypothetical protein DDX39_06560 [Bacteroidales bacterium]|nr:MAG: hypothetical protein A2W98_11400 [Bacteroidetes bacterium GWF2_33_38]OFY88376.1 MAG: hypothetical protein A2236_06935 [Bacteroidetes bacterium RIFOXYA2_FULL_33_7]HBF88288.1 hypothetical protein [Bacteroidales bacterium]